MDEPYDWKTGAIKRLHSQIIIEKALEDKNMTKLDKFIQNSKTFLLSSITTAGLAIVGILLILLMFFIIMFFIDKIEIIVDAIRACGEM